MKKIKINNMINYKIALCLSGNLRTYEKTYSNNKKYLFDLLNNFDVYIHTWDYQDNISNGNLPAIKLDKNLSFKLQEMYNPKRIIIEDNIKKMNDIELLSNQIKWNVGPGCQPLRTMIMWYSRYKSIELIENIDYDYVIISRFDNIFSNEITENDFDHDSICIPRPAMNNNGCKFNGDDKYYVGSVGDFMNGYMDQFFISSKENALLISDFYNNMFQYWKDGNMFHAEYLLKHHFNMNNCNIKRIDLKIELLRYNRDINGNYIHTNQKNLEY